MRANNERIYDYMERKSHEAIMFANAGNSRKRTKAKDLFKRPNDEHAAEDSSKKFSDKHEDTMRWLAQFEEFRGKEGVNGN